MKVTVEHEKTFFNYYLSNPQLLKQIGNGFFSNSDIDRVAKIAKDFYIKFGEPPSSDQMTMLVSDDPHEISTEIVESIYAADWRKYEKDWVKRTAEAWIQWRHFNKQLIRTIEFVKTQDVSPENVEDVVGRAINMISVDGSISFDADIGLDFFNPEHHIQRQSQKIETGWTFIDRISGGGYDPKSLVVYAGQANIGKSIWLANDAANFVRMGHNVAFITAEMADQKVLKRIGSNLLSIPMANYEEKSANRDLMKRKLERVSRSILPPGKLFVKEFPTSQASVLDIDAYLKVLEETQDHKVNVLIVDYLNILANYRNPNTENTYMKIKQIAEDLRALAVRRNMLIISATQINRGAWDSTEVNMENISESAGLAHTVDVMYALIQDQMMHAGREYWLKVLKIRDGHGKGSKCRFTIDYDYMRLSETDDIMN